jgi:Cdc6-like AAA superfamily ATPase
MDGDRKYRLMGQILETFTPGSPIDHKDLFAGRKRQREKLLNTIFQKGEHAILFGERGVGKSSLANIMYDFLVVMSSFSYVRAKVNCSESMTFADLWRSIFRQLTFEEPEGTTLTLDLHLPENPNSENIRETFQLVDNRSIIIIDEFDKVSDATLKRDMADTIKTLSDNAVATTLILVGVGDSIDDLIAEHKSIERNIVQVPMKRMVKYELLEIIDKGLTKCEELTIENEPRQRIADYSQGLPYYTHLLTRECALAALEAGRVTITMQDLNAGVVEAVDGKLETNLTAYNAAVDAPRGEYFKPVLLACALAHKNDQQWFFARDVVAPLRYITQKGNIDIPAFAKHLKAFCEEDRGRILERKGPARKVQYRFAKPLMEPYVILRGLADGLIREPELSRPSANATEPEQLSLLFDASGPPSEI